jgi:hypothetical protein
MDRKPTVLLEAWQVVTLHGRPVQLRGYATGHPHLTGFRRHIATSSIIRIDHEQREAETLNSVYRLRRRLTDVQRDRDCLMRMSLCHLSAERRPEAGIWDVRDDHLMAATNLSNANLAILAMLAILDREGFDDSAN